MKLIIKIFFYLCFATSSLLAQQDLVVKTKLLFNEDSILKHEVTEILKFKLSKDTVKLIEAYLKFASKCNNLSRYKKANDACTEALKLSQIIKNNLLIADCYTTFANTYSSKQDNRNALNYYLKATDLYRKFNNVKKQLNSIINLAEFYRKIAQFEKAQDYINKSFFFYKTYQLADTTILIRVYNRQAAIKFELTQKDSSLFYSFKALELSKLSHNKDAEARSLNEIGAVYRDKKDMEKAIWYIANARDIWLESKSYMNALEAMNNLAILYEKNNYAKSFVINEYNNIIAIVQQNSLDFQLMNAYEYLYKTYITKQDTAKAFIHLLNLKKSHEKYMYQKLNAEIVSLGEKYENEKITNEVKQKNVELINQKKEIKTVIIVLIVFSCLLLLNTYLLYDNIQKKKLLHNQNSYKDSLIQEIHHRVKNNLQFISSLINMQITSSQTDSEKHTLNDTSRRIKSMALVHEMLYSNNKVEGINIKTYLNELVNSINELVNSDNLPVTFTLDVDELKTDANQATALGMITSELVSNSIKYAFINQPNPQIKITLKHQINTNYNCIYNVSDNGIGINTQTKNKLGMRLIDIFSRQLKGNYQIKNDNGLTYLIEFKL